MPQFSDKVAMLYPNLVGGETYVMPSNIFEKKGNGVKYDTGRVFIMGNGGEFEKVDEGVVQLTQNDRVQLCFTTSKGYGSSFVESDRSKMALSKFMQDNRDWHNIEFTVVFEYMGGADLEHIILGTRTGLGATDPCQGASYKAGLQLNASGGFISKQQYAFEGNDYRTFDTTKMGSTIKSKTVALKLVVYDLDAAGAPTMNRDLATQVKIEFYGSTGGSNPFRLLEETVDNGGWGQADVCGGVAGQIFLWGGPMSTLEWRNGADIRLVSLSIREIDPTDDFDDTILMSSTSFPVSAAFEETEENVLSASATIETGQVNDKNGVRQIYKTKPGGSVWIPSKTGLLSDKRFSDNGYTIKHKGNGVYTVKGKSRIQSFSTTEAADKGPDYDGYATHNYRELHKRGAWDDTRTDFRNIEMTAYVRMTNASSSGEGNEISFVVRSVRHNNDSNNGCGGSSYHGNITSDGFPRFKKEDWHVEYQNDKPGPRGIGNIQGKTVGLKFVCYNVDEDTVHLELWFDKNNDNKWEKYQEKDDAGDWTSNGPDMKHCGATSNTAAITWGSPKVIWKWNDPMNVDISKMSVREIIPELEGGPPTTPPPPGGGDPPSTGGTGTVSRILTRYVCHYDVIVDSSGFVCTGAAPPSPTGSYTEVSGISVTTINDDKELAVNWASEDDRTEVGWYVADGSSKLEGVKPTKIAVYLKRAGSVTGLLHVYVRDSSRNIIAEYGPAKDVSTLTTSYVLTEFVNDNAPPAMPNGLEVDWQIAVEWSNASGTGSSQCVKVGINTSNPVDGTHTHEYQFEREPGPEYAIVKQTGRDMAGRIYKSP